jgi:hypothetical protein
VEDHEAAPSASDEKELVGLRRRSRTSCGSPPLHLQATIGPAVGDATDIAIVRASCAGRSWKAPRLRPNLYLRIHASDTLAIQTIEQHTTHSGSQHVDGWLRCGVGERRSMFPLKGGAERGRKRRL